MRRLTALALASALLGGCSSGEGERPSADAIGDRPPDRAESGVTSSPGEIPATVAVTITGETFDLELAADVPTRQRGLMYRRAIDPSGGMLFVFTRSQVQSFWMGWCLVDIDIIYLDPKGRVTAFHQMKVESPQQPGETEAEYRERLPRYPSRLPAQFVIELAGGTLDRLSVAVGDAIPFDHAGLAALAR